MERLIANAWRAVWVALGAILVLLAQAALTPKAPAPELPAQLAPAPEPHHPSDPMLSQVHSMMPRS